jgi:hypothetical protein
MNTHKPKPNNNGKKALPNRALKRKFEGNAGRVVLYNNIPSMPDEFDTIIKSYCVVGSAAATASILVSAFTNSLLQSASDFSAAVSGNALANIGRNYNKYRVTGYKCSYVLSPRTTIDIQVSVMHSPDAQTYSSAVTWTGESTCRDKSKYHQVPANTKSPCMVYGKSSYSMSAIIGNPEFHQDDKYVGTLSTIGVPTAPTDLTYLSFYMGGVGGGAFTASTAPYITLSLTQYVKFFDKRA